MNSWNKSINTLKKKSLQWLDFFSFQVLLFIPRTSWFFGYSLVKAIYKRIVRIEDRILETEINSKTMGAKCNVLYSKRNIQDRISDQYHSSVGEKFSIKVFPRTNIL